MHDVHAVVDGNAEDERDTDQVGGIEFDPQQPHEAECLGHAEGQWQRREQRVFDAAEVEPEHGEDHDQRIECRLFVAPFHFERGLVGLQRVARRPRVDAPHVLHETLERFEIPDVAPAVDLEQVLAALTDEAVDEARRQVGERRRLRIGHVGERMEAAEQVARRPLLKRGQRLKAFVGPHAAERIAGAFEVPGRPQGAGPLRGFRLGPGKRFTEGVEAIDRDLGRPFRQLREPAADPFDERPLELLVHGQQRRDLVHPLHAREFRELFLPCEQLLPGVGHRKGIPNALITLRKQLLLDLHALEPVGLHVEEVVVVVEVVHPRGDRHRRRQRRQRHESRMPHQRREPGMHRHRLRQPAAKGSAVDDRHHGRQHEQFRGAAEQDSAAGNQSQLGHAHEAREGGAEEGHGGRDRAGENAWADRGARLEERRLAVETAAPHLEVAADVVGAIVDPDADHGDGERHAQDIQMAHARRRPAKGPGHADDEHAVGHERVPDTAEAGDDHHDHRRERQAAGPHHRLGARPHLVVFHDGQAREADRHVGMPRRRQFHQPPQFVRRGRGTGETLLRLRQPQEHEPEFAVLGEQVLARQVAERGERLRHSRPGGDVFTGPGIPGLRPRIEPRHEALAVAFQCGRGRLVVRLRRRRRAGHHLAGKPTHHRGHLQLGPAAVENRLRALDEAVDFGEVGGRQVMQALRANLGEIDLVEHGAEERAIAGHLFRDLPEHPDHALARSPLHHDDGVVILAELRDVIDPQLVVFALGIEQIGAVHLVAKGLRRPPARGHGRPDRQQDDGEAVSQAEPCPADKRAAEQTRAGRVRGRLRAVVPDDGLVGAGLGLVFALSRHRLSPTGRHRKKARDSFFHGRLGGTMVGNLRSRANTRFAAAVASGVGWGPAKFRWAN